MISPSETKTPNTSGSPPPDRSPAETMRHAETLSAAGWHAEAVQLLTDLASTPAGSHPRFRILLAEVLLAAGRFDDAEQVNASGPLPQGLVTGAELDAQPAEAGRGDDA